jgi:hypothetical protein
VSLCPCGKIGKYSVALNFSVLCDSLKEGFSVALGVPVPLW